VTDYDLLRRIGGGAYGEVWLARSRATGVLRAVKIVWPHTFEDERPYRREFEGIQRFEQISREHPRQLALFHIGRNDAERYFYYVMELADPLENPKPETRNPKQTRNPKSEASAAAAASRPSESGLPASSGTWASDSYAPHTLRADLANGRLPAARVLEIGLALSEALVHLHEKGLVHRDVKPSNVIFVNGRPKLADIGLVTNASDQCSIVGTEGYLPPEGPGTPRADIFARGKVLYEAATGLDRREFPKLPEDLRGWPDAKLVFELNEILLKACATEQGQRYPTAEGMLKELALLQAGKSVRRKRTLQWWRVAGTKAGIALSALSAVAVISVWQRDSSARYKSSIDGPDSTNMEANAYCDKAKAILRDDNSGQFATAYADLNKAITLDTNFARPWIYLLELRAREAVPGIPAATTEVVRNIMQHLKQIWPRRMSRKASSIGAIGISRTPSAIC
jgi:serine/threonine protein kinase